MLTLQPIKVDEPSALIAEDNDLHRIKIERILRGAAWNVRATGDSRRALEMATNARFDVLILDHRMPHLLGLDVARQLKAKGVNTPVIMVTSFPDAQFQREAKEVGVFKFLPAPVDATALLQTLERLNQERSSSPR